MKIGLLAFHSACNFGASLQLLSTYMYLKQHGHVPVIINWSALDLEAYYGSHVPQAQLDNQLQVRQQLWEETPLCRTTEDVAHVIEGCGIEAVIIGSDAVAQHHPWLERLVFPCRTVIGLRGTMTSTQYPNPFWATWLPLLSHSIPVAAMSVSNQDSSYRLIPPGERKAMGNSILSYSYASVRDEWTQKMFVHLTKGKLTPPVTPDPVFAFTQNASSILPSIAQIRERFHLPERYLLLSFLPTARPSVTQEWIDEFSRIAADDGLTCVMLPFSHGDSFGTLPHTISLPLSPVDWFSLIIHSQGYVGNNMHPIVVSLANQIPFFSFDTYGTPRLNGLYVNQSSSKILHLLQTAGFADHRVSCTARRFTPPSPDAVYGQLKAFDRNGCQAFADRFLSLYNQMMTDILNSFANG